MLYSQIHPAKLFTDISMSVVSLYLFWVNSIMPALLLHILPSVAISYVIIRLARLERYSQNSSSSLALEADIIARFLHLYQSNRT
jgi:hypothetical protein